MAVVAENKMLCTVNLWACLIAGVGAGLGFTADLLLFENSIKITLAALSVSVFLITFPAGVRLVHRVLSGGSINGAAAENDLFWAYVGLVIVLTTGWVGGLVGFVSWPVFALLGGGQIILTTWFNWDRGPSYLNWAVFLTFTVLLGLYTASFIPDTVAADHLLQVGLLRRDTLLHINIANMLKTYSRMSVGVDGPIGITYHCGYNWVMVQLSNVFGATVVKTYSFATLTVIVPFVFRVFGGYAVSRRRFICAAEYKTDDAGAEHSLIGRPVFWVIFCLAVSDFLPFDLSQRISMPSPEILNGWGYAFGVALSLIYYYYLEKDVLVISKIHGGGVTPANIGRIIFPTSLIFGMYLIKPPFAIMAFCSLGYFWIRLRLFKSTLVTLNLVFSLIGLIIAVILFRVDTNPDRYFAINIVLTYFPYGLLLYFAWSIILTVTVFNRHNIRTIAEAATLIKNRTLIGWELTMILAFGGLIWWLFIPLYGTYVYFAEVQKWIALGMLMTSLTFRSSQTEQEPVEQDRWTITSVFVCIFAFFVALNLFVQTNRQISVLGQYNKTARQYYSTAYQVAGENLSKIFSGQTILPPRKWNGNPQTEVMRLLRKLDHLPADAKKRSILYIPKTIKGYWRMTDDRTCAPFIAGAAAGLAMIDGWPDGDIGGDAGSIWRRILPYKKTLSPQPQTELYIPTLCRRAKAMGMTWLLVLDYNPKKGFQVRRWSCNRPEQAPQLIF